MTVPTCAACGKRLPPFVDAKTLVRGEASHADWRKAHRAPEQTADGLPPTRGRLGDNVVYGQVCGYNLLIRLFAAEPDILRLLPPGHDPKAKAEAAALKRRTRAKERREERKIRKVAHDHFNQAHHVHDVD